MMLVLLIAINISKPIKELLNRLLSLQSELIERYERKIDKYVGMGIAKGNVIMGNIGSENRKDYTIIGSNVNLAARLCSLATPGEVLISSTVQRAALDDERIAHVLAFEPHGRIELKGFSKPVHVFGVGYNN